MKQAKKLIEVAMPIKEISAESVRDKSIRHGHISTLHLWWARRPLPVCRAVIFASLVPDPLDENCPQSFRDAIEILLGKTNNFGDPYHPYLDIPWTTVFDPMEDNLRNRLQMFIGKFTDEMQQHLLHHKPKPGADSLLNNNCLIKWDNKNNEVIINKARKLIWVAYNSKLNNKATATELLEDFEIHYQAIKDAENELYAVENRHLPSEESKLKSKVLNESIDRFLSKMPKVFDPFAGGGAIPLEAARLGCKSYGNDINPVAHIIQKGSLEFPQKYGKPIIYGKAEFVKRYGKETWDKLSNESLVYENGDAVATKIPNRLKFDVEFYSNKLLTSAEKEIGHLYPSDSNGKKPIAYYWARVGTCSNPSCKAEVPLLKGFYLANTPKKQVYLKPKINDNQINFTIEEGVFEEVGWMTRGNLKCPCCGNATDVKNIKNQFVEGLTKERLLAVIWDGKNGKDYKLPTEADINSVSNLPMEGIERPLESMPIKYTQAMPSCTWGISSWGQMFSNRQLLAIQTLIKHINLLKIELNDLEDYKNAIITYLAFIVDKSADYNSSFCTWHSGREVIGHVFTKQAIPMVLDYPEVYPFTSSSGGIHNMIDWITRYIVSEQNEFSTELKNASSGDKSQFSDKSITAVVTDPPYYDAIAYADLSDFFYVWLKRSLSDIYPLNFATHQTPKTEECTALKHNHNDSKSDAKEHFENKLTEIFDAIEHQTTDIVSIMFAHQSTEAWTTLCNSILGSRMNITGSWPVDTEMANRSLGLAGAVLESSVTVSCKPSQRQGNGDYKIVKKAIETTVEAEVELLYNLGFRGADLLTACFGQAVSEFGKYEKVEKADGSEVTVSDLLELSRESAFNALLKGFDGDGFTKFYIGWLQLYGFAKNDHNAAMRIAQIGLTVKIQDLYKEGILIQEQSNATLANFEQRLELNPNCGLKPGDSLLDQVHRAMVLFKGNNRNLLLKYINNIGNQPESNFWRVLTSLCELLPNESEDHKQALGLLTNKDSLIRESKQSSQPTSEQATLEL